MSDLISFIFGSRQRLNISPGTIGTPRSPFSADIQYHIHFITMRNPVYVYPAVPESPGVGALGCRHAPERERLVVKGTLGKV